MTRKVGLSWRCAEVPSVAPGGYRERAADSSHPVGAEVTDVARESSALDGLYVVEWACPTELTQRAAKVASDQEWLARVQLDPPRAVSSKPRVKPTRVLSDSRVVKQFGMREYLRDKCPGRLLLEMEGSGAAQACHDCSRPYPIVVKAACDWATPSKEKMWQPYCADVAAAFAVEMALGLTARRAAGR